MSKKGEYVVTSKAKPSSNKGMVTLRKGAILESCEGGYQVQNPQEKEVGVVFTSATINSLKKMKSVVSTSVQDDVNKLAGASSVKLEQAVSDLTAKLAEANEKIEELEAIIVTRDATIDSLTNAKLEDDGADLNDLDESEEEDK